MFINIGYKSFSNKQRLKVRYIATTNDVIEKLVGNKICFKKPMLLTNGRGIINYEGGGVLWKIKAFNVSDESIGL